MKTAYVATTLAIGIVLALPAVPARAQDGQRWEPARLADGQPDVQGLWAAAPGGSVSLSNPISGGADLQRRITGQDVRLPSRIIDPPDGEVPYQPWAAALREEQERLYDNPTKPEHIDPQHRCMLSGIPRLYTTVPPHRIVQPRGAVLIIWDEYHAYRYIPLDNRPRIAPNVKLWMGDGRGRWDGHTLVVETTNIKGNRLSFTGDFLSDNARVTERITFVDAETMHYEATVEDATVYTRPWTMRVVHKRRPYEEMWEAACFEGNRPPDSWLLNGETRR